MSTEASLISGMVHANHVRNTETIKVKLPGGMHTVFQPRKGLLLRDAMDRKLTSRNMRVEICSAYRVESNVKHVVDWATDTILLKNETLSVEFRDQYKEFAMLSHDIVSKRILFGSCCVCKERIVLEGYVCRSCSLKCHKLCGEKLPRICQGPVNSSVIHKLPFEEMSPIIDPSNNQEEATTRSLGAKRGAKWARRLGTESPPDNGNLSPSLLTNPSNFPSKATLRISGAHDSNSRVRTRSTSEPNVSMNGVNNNISITPPSESQLAVHPAGGASGANNSAKMSNGQSSKFSTGGAHSVKQQQQHMVYLSTPIAANRETRSADARNSSSKLKGFTPIACRTRVKSSGTPGSIQVNKTKSPSSNGSSSYLSAHGAPLFNDSNQTSQKDLRTGKLHKIWAIPSSDLDIKERIGSGSFGTVYKGAYHGIVAVKKLNITNPTKEQLTAFENEVMLLKSCRHANILNFYGYTCDKYLAIVTHWCEGKSLYWHIHVEDSENPDKPYKKFAPLENDHRFNGASLQFEIDSSDPEAAPVLNKLSIYEKLDIARQTAQGMSYLHSKGIIHRDLKSNNIFLLDDFTVKIGDFGLATLKSKWDNTGSVQERQPTGSILWMAPEVLIFRSDCPYGFKSDVYSFGIVLFELFSGKLPYNGLCRDVIIYMVGKGFLKPDLSQCEEDTPPDVKELMNECVQKNPDNRKLFPDIQLQLQQLLAAQPKIQRSNSAPSILDYRCRTTTTTEDSLFYDQQNNAHHTPNPAIFPSEAVEAVFFPVNSSDGVGEV